MRIYDTIHNKMFIRYIFARQIPKPERILNFDDHKKKAGYLTSAHSLL